LLAGCTSGGNVKGSAAGGAAEAIDARLHIALSSSARWKLETRFLIASGPSLDGAD
jgi:hypothetical protein